MKTLSKKHWIAFFIIVTIYISFFMLVSSTYTSMFGAIFESLLCIFLIHNFLKESLEEYGFHFRKMGRDSDDSQDGTRHHECLL